MDWLFLVALGIMWTAFLLPSDRRRASPDESVRDFRRNMDLLAATDGNTQGRWIVTPQKGMPFLGSQRRAQARARARRRSRTGRLRRVGRGDRRAIDASGSGGQEGRIGPLAALDEIAHITKDGPSTAELDKAKRMALGGRLDDLQTMSGQASEIGSAWALAKDLSFADQYLERLAAPGKHRSDDLGIFHLLRPSLSGGVATALRHSDTYRAATAKKVTAASSVTPRSVPHSVRFRRTTCTRIVTWIPRGGP